MATEQVNLTVLTIQLSSEVDGLTFGVHYSSGLNTVESLSSDPGAWFESVLNELKSELRVKVRQHTEELRKAAQ